MDTDLPAEAMGEGGDTKGSKNPNAYTLMGDHPADITLCLFDKAQSASDRIGPTWLIRSLGPEPFGVRHRDILCVSMVNKLPEH